MGRLGTRLRRLARWAGGRPSRYRRVAVRGGSMAPTLADGDVVVARLGARCLPGAVALVSWDGRPGQLSVKRLALRFDDGTWFAVGDAPTASTDSRTLGPARADGPVLWRLWPRPGRVRRSRR